MEGMDHPSMPGMSETENHGESSSKEIVSTAKARLLIDGKLKINQPKKLIILIQDAQGKSVTKFDTFQEKLMHLIVVSDDLQVFQHLHPKHQGNGQFTIDAALPSPGPYTLVADYKPSGNMEVVSLMTLLVPGKVSVTTTTTLQRSKTIGTTKINLSTSAPEIKAREEVGITFSLTDAMKKPIQDLKPYLGAQGHLVVIRQSKKIIQTDYVHAHAMKGTDVGEVVFMTKFPQLGKYKIWGQFNRGGKIIVADFWMDAL
jgi:hypothetical protein